MAGMLVQAVTGTQISERLEHTAALGVHEMDGKAGTNDIINRDFLRSVVVCHGTRPDKAPEFCFGPESAPMRDVLGDGTVWVYTTPSAEDVWACKAGGRLAVELGAPGVILAYVGIAFLPAREAVARIPAGEPVPAHLSYDTASWREFLASAECHAQGFARTGVLRLADPGEAATVSEDCIAVKDVVCVDRIAWEERHVGMTMFLNGCEHTTLSPLLCAAIRAGAIGTYTPGVGVYEMVIGPMCNVRMESVSFSRQPRAVDAEVAAV